MKDKEYPKYLKICSPKQAFKLWIDFNGSNSRISGDLYDMFGGSESDLYKEWARKPRDAKEGLTEGQRK